jgi:hypothetical protein
MAKRVCAVHCPRPGDWGVGTALSMLAVFCAAALACYGAARVVPDLVAWLLGLAALVFGVAFAVTLLVVLPVVVLLRRADLGRHALGSQRTVAAVTRQNLVLARKRARVPEVVAPVRVGAELVPLPAQPVRQPLGVPPRGGVVSVPTVSAAVLPPRTR